MKTRIATSILLLIPFLFACQNDAVTPPATGTKPIHAVYIDSKTGANVGEDLYTYNADGNVLSHKFITVNGSAWNKENVFEYDSDGKLIKEKGRSTEYDITKVPFGVTEFLYKNGLKWKTLGSTEGDPTIQSQAEFFYSSTNLPDSVVMTVTGQTSYNAERYTYDNAGHMISKTFVNNGTVTSVYQYGYAGNNLVMVCTPDCLWNQYNAEGQVTSTIGQRNGITFKSADYFYKDGKLDEKWLYLYDNLDVPTDYASITKIKYEY